MCTVLKSKDGASGISEHHPFWEKTSIRADYQLNIVQVDNVLIIHSLQFPPTKPASIFTQALSLQRGHVDNLPITDFF